MHRRHLAVSADQLMAELLIYARNRTPVSVLIFEIND